MHFLFSFICFQKVPPKSKSVSVSVSLSASVTVSVSGRVIISDSYSVSESIIEKE